ncbi:MAG TPA: hypothetical protein VFU73_03665 [Actinocrinis sp.]|nr:hypothetical protein [Actinocrinis sp.]
MVVRRRHTGRSTATVIGAVATGTMAIGAMFALPAQAVSGTASPAADASCSPGSPSSSPSTDPVSPAADGASDSSSAQASSAADPSDSPTDTPTTDPSPCSTSTSPSASASPSPSDSASPSASPTPSAPTSTPVTPPTLSPPPADTSTPVPTGSPFYTPPPPADPGPDGSGDVTVTQQPGSGNPYSYLSVPPGNSSLRLPHGSITRAQIIQRAQRWLTEQVPYSQSAWWRDAGGIYRQDCSGYVSMAWALDQTVDFWTGNLNTVSHTIDPSQLLPGDILLSQEHTVLFAGWADAAHTQFDYYEESHPGTNARFVVDAPLSAFLAGGFGAFRYDGVTGPDSGLPANPAQGLDFESLQAGGSELMPNGILTAAPPVAAWQAGFLPPSVAAKVSKAAQPQMKPVADVTSIEPPLGYVLASGGMVFVVGGAVIARGAPRLASTARGQRRRH